MDIACLDEDIVPGVTLSQEIEPTNMLSVIANLTPFSDFNQSPVYIDYFSSSIFWLRSCYVCLLA